MENENRKYYLLVILIAVIGFLLRLRYFALYYHEPVDFTQYVQNARYFAGSTSDYGIPRPPFLGLLYFLLSFLIELSYNNLRLVSIVWGSFNVVLVGIYSHNYLSHHTNLSKPSLTSLGITLLFSTHWIVIWIDNLAVRETYVVTLFILFHYLIVQEHWSNIQTILLGLVFLFLILLRGEFAYVGIFVGLSVLFQSNFLNSKDGSRPDIFVIKGLIILFSSILGWILNSLLFYYVFGDISAGTNFLIGSIVDLSDPSIDSGGLLWYVFEFLGVFEFGRHVIFGTFGLILVIFNLFSPIIFLFSTFEIFRSQKSFIQNVPIIILLSVALLINSFNAYAFEYLGYLRILMPFLVFFILFGISGIFHIKELNLFNTHDQMSKIGNNIHLVLFLGILTWNIFELWELLV